MPTSDKTIFDKEGAFAFTLANAQPFADIVAVE
jgi:hypothetical protein